MSCRRRAWPRLAAAPWVRHCGVPYVSITRLRLRDEAFLDEFMTDSLAAHAQAGAATGNLGLDLLVEAANTFWTKSTWTDRAAMRAFMASGEHAATMPKLRTWCDEAHVAHWEQQSAELPTWEEAHRQLLAVGRRSAVDHPTPAHESMDLPPPVLAD